MTVEYESVHDAMKIAKKLKKTWIDDKLIKVRTMKDRHLEHYDNRTIVIKDLPTNAKSRHVIEFMKTFGVITSVEMPFKDGMQE
jgi:RNA recognition motif-containing protein